ncbi:hypothetical protein D3C87_2093140 [compost metagenome]
MEGVDHAIEARAQGRLADREPLVDQGQGEGRGRQGQGGMPGALGHGLDPEEEGPQALALGEQR